MEQISQVHTDVRYMATQAAIRMSQDSGLIDLSAEDYEFLSRDRMFLQAERSQARRCIEATVYGAIDACGLPRVTAPVEFVAGAIVAHVHPDNWMIASRFMEGAEWMENIINGVDQKVSATQIYSHCVRCGAGMTGLVEGRFETLKRLKDG